MRLAGSLAEVIAAVRDPVAFFLAPTNAVVLGAFGRAILADVDETPAHPVFLRGAIDFTVACGRAHNIDDAAAQLRKLVPSAGTLPSRLVVNHAR